jgi:hypothetical protein
MSATAAITCPKCENALNVPTQYFGKKIKCRHCGHAFVARDPDDEPARPGKSAGPAKAARPGAKPAAASPPPPPPSSKPVWDEEDEAAAGGMAKPMEVIAETDVPRCPHCAKELDPPDAKVCVHCGYNNVTRMKADTRKVWAPTAEEWIRHLLPGIVALAIVIGLIVFNIISAVSMREWLEGTFLERDEVDAAGRKRFFISPGAFIFFIAAVSLIILIPAAKFAFRRLVREYRPTERLKL